MYELRISLTDGQTQQSKHDEEPAICFNSSSFIEIAIPDEKRVFYVNEKLVNSITITEVENRDEPQLLRTEILTQ